jgi:DHA2 family methylenomycin A resistance protein-like MFS transporter
VQGVGAALLVPSSLVLLQAAYPTRAGRARAFGAWGAIAGIGATSGPVVGGLLVTAWSWRGVFFLNLPFALAALALAGWAVPATGPGKRDVDLPGQLLGVAGLGLLTWSLVEAGQAGWSSPRAMADFAASAAAWAGFARAEHLAADSMLPLRLFARPGFRAGSAVGLLINLGFYGQLFLMSLYLQDARGYSALGAGLALLPEAALLIVASTLSGRIMARTGPRLPMLAGLLLGGAGLLSLVVAGAHIPYALLVVPMAAAGFGMALTMPAATASVIEAAPPTGAGSQPGWSTRPGSPAGCSASRCSAR